MLLGSVQDSRVSFDMIF